jgi:hypothetical protein
MLRDPATFTLLVAALMQGKGLKQPVWQFEVPEWAQAEDEQGKVVTKSDIVPTGELS